MSPGLVKSKGRQVQEFARRLKLALEAAGMIPADLERSTGIDAGTISRWLKGQRGASVDPMQMFRVSSALGCDFAWLLTGNGRGPQMRTGAIAELTNTTR